MGNREIKKYDFILITDPNEKDRYLNVGEVVDIDYYPDGDIKEYTVRFNGVCGRYKDMKTFRSDLPQKCRVLQFKD